MQHLRNYSTGSRLEPRTGKDFLFHIILAHLRGLTPEQFAEEELARMNAEREDYTGPDPPA